MKLSTITTLWCFFLAGLLITACSTSPTGRNQLVLVSEEQMTAMGDEAFNKMKEQQDRVTDSGTSAYVECVSEKVTQAAPGSHQWEVAVFADDAVNAFALPGGKIGVFTGLLDITENQHQLAAVIAHEVAHVVADHHTARVSSQLATQLGTSVVSEATGLDPQLITMGADLLLTLPYSRADEAEADQLGLDSMARAGFNPRASIALWRNMANSEEARPPELLSTHPSPDSRIKAMESHMTQARELYERARAAGKQPSCS